MTTLAVNASLEKFIKKLTEMAHQNKCLPDLKFLILVSRGFLFVRKFLPLVSEQGAEVQFIRIPRFMQPENWYEFGNLPPALATLTDWTTRSDHLPLVVDLAVVPDAALAASA